MYKTDIVIARPQPGEQLVLIFHGVGSSSQDLAPLGQALANTHKGAAVVCVQAPYASELGRGHEWFSVMGVTEDNRPERIAQAMPLFFQSVHHWQDVMGIGAERTVLVGFSQGAIMALEASQTAVSLAAKVIAMAGRFAQPARQAPPGMQFHLIHGERDGVILPQWSVQAHQQLGALGGDVTLDLLPGLGHGIDDRALHQVIHYLSPNSLV